VSLPLRNVDADLTDPADIWPFEAVQTALERGGISEWALLIAAIRAEPWGHAARCVEQTLAIREPYGVGPLMRRVLAEARDAAEQRERAEVAARIRAAIAASGLTQRDFAERVGTSPSRLSTYASGKVVPSATMLLRIEARAGKPPAGVSRPAPRR
jgi:DNA-binding transcriptional regulator YiaG